MFIILFSIKTRLLFCDKATVSVW